MRTPVTPWLIAAIEGFSTLAVEVIAIRLAVPVVGSSVTLTGVMLGIVLLALSAGYWRGGALSAEWDKTRIRTALARNLFLAAVLYGGLAFPFEATALEKLLDAGFSLPLSIGVTAAALFLLPIYLASQTVPLLAELINTEGKAGKASGRILFYSTIGSVAGGIVTPVWLFPSIGVVRSTYVVCAMLAAIAAALAVRHLSVRRTAGAAAMGLVVVVGANALAAPSNALFSFDSAYQSIRVVEEKGAGGRPTRVLLMSGSRSSGVYEDNGETSFEYVRAAERAFEEAPAEQALVIGAAGFTFPRDAARLSTVKRVDAVDVDPVVKRVAEQNFLLQRLSPKIRFLPLSARYALRRLRAQGVHYGFAFVDAYFARGIPEELTTVEFFRDIQGIADRTAANVVMDRDMESPFARNLLATFREGFGAAWTHDVLPGDDELTNVLVTNWPAQGATQWHGAGTVYRDDRNSSDRDHVEMMW